MLDVTVLLLNDNYASTAIGPIEVFHSAGLLWNALKGEAPEPRCRVTIASLDGASVTSPYSLRLSPQVSIHDIEHTDVIMVPASGFGLQDQFARHAAIFPWLRDQAARGAHIAGICTGAAYLAEAGLLDGRLATTHWAVADDFRRRYPKVDWHPERFVTEDRRMLCSGGVYASIDLSLYLVEKFCGHEIALQCAKALLLDMPRTNQSGYAVLPVSRPHDDDKIRAAEAYIEKHFASDISVERVARHIHMSPRNFIRRFKSATGRLPGNYLQALRIIIAKKMLEDGRQSVQAISAAVGYDDAAFFRKLFKRSTGMTPGEYRERFAGPRYRAPRRATESPQAAGEHA